MQLESMRRADETEQRPCAEELAASLIDLERQLQERTTALAKANILLEQSKLELQQFAYVVSHDLQAPLRGIVGFAQFLQSDYRGQLDETADEYIGHILAGTQQMQRLICDLLAYSRVESQAHVFTATDLAAVFDDTVSLHRATIEAVGGLVTRGDLPNIAGDPAQLSQLFNHLIDNALKFHSRKPPHVDVTSEQRNGEYIIAVRDNGIGIAAKNHERIFEIFRRLHTQEQYPGTGIGLAICRRIVRRHGGRIWVESAAGKGSTFFFTVPERVS